MSDDGVLFVMSGWCASFDQLDALEGDLEAAMNASGKTLLGEIGYDVITAWDAPRRVIEMHGAGGAALPFLAENPNGCLVFAVAEVEPPPAEHGHLCPCCDAPLVEP